MILMYLLLIECLFKCFRSAWSWCPTTDIRKLLHLRFNANLPSHSATPVCLLWNDDEAFEARTEVNATSHGIATNWFVQSIKSTQDLTSP